MTHKTSLTELEALYKAAVQIDVTAHLIAKEATREVNRIFDKLEKARADRLEELREERKAWNARYTAGNEPCLYDEGSPNRAELAFLEKSCS